MEFNLIWFIIFSGYYQNGRFGLFVRSSSFIFKVFTCSRFSRLHTSLYGLFPSQLLPGVLPIKQPSSSPFMILWVPVQNYIRSFYHIFVRQCLPQIYVFHYTCNPCLALHTYISFVFLVLFSTQVHKSLLALFSLPSISHTVFDIAKK